HERKRGATRPDMCQRSVTSRMPQIASIKLPYLLYCYLLIIHLCGAKKNKIHRNPGQKNVRLPLPDSFADGSQRSDGGAIG
ncbi:TPA: hypothetical protein ACYRKD_004525, partial [Enterobacter hormaechei]